MAAVGIALLRGDGAPADPPGGLRWLERAANLDDIRPGIPREGAINARYALGVAYLDGDCGLPADERKGVAWLLRVGTNPSAQDRLAQYYASKGDAHKAAHWARLADRDSWPDRK